MKRQTCILETFNTKKTTRNLIFIQKTPEILYLYIEKYCTNRKFSKPLIREILPSVDEILKCCDGDSMNIHEICYRFVSHVVSAFTPC